ncbi:hypothetical protein B2G71_17620 [Novosphingobium sp. PC22D]|uniref:alpha/beta fold hydrolase n=1 Tax=Novosphingobium sp. PC22D TaxID=1962403 RepID=UPI000BFADC02|nr:alpha/beta hydrolase [Novosphingobium sp. PC22D]PEQ11371.1 hypothetical protein B2G71_17620 [Novosphingobium sp. PC22D]
MKRPKAVALPKVRRAYCDGPHGQVHYRIAAPQRPRKPPLVCLHQTPKSGMDYEPIMPLLAQDRVVLAPDTPGYGGSDPPSRPIGIPAFARFAALFIGTMRHAGFIGSEPVDVMGYHTGCITAAELATSQPTLVRKLVMVSLPAFDARERSEHLAQLDRFPTPRADASHVGDLWRVMETLHDSRVGLDWKHASLAEALRPGARLPWGFKAVYEYDFLATLDRLRNPVLLLCPGDDLWEPTQRHHDRIANLTMIEKPGAAHGFLLVDAQEVAEEIRQFLDQRPPRP